MLFRILKREYYFFEYKRNQEIYLHLFDSQRRYKKREKWDFSRRNIKNAYLHLDLNYWNFRLLNLPFKDPDKIEEVIPYELEQLLEGKLEDIVYDFYILEDGRILVGYVGKKLLEKIIHQFQNSNIDLKVITCSDALSFLKNFSLPELPLEERLDNFAREIKTPTFNLLTRFKKKRKFNLGFKSVALLGFLIFINLILLNGYFLLKKERIKQEEKVSKERLKKVYRYLFPDEKLLSPFYQLTAKKKILTETKDLLKHVEPLEFLKNLAAAKFPLGIKLKKIVLKAGEVRKREIEGTADKVSTFQKLKESLLDKFQLEVKSNKILADKKVYFKINLKEKKENAKK